MKSILAMAAFIAAIPFTQMQADITVRPDNPEIAYSGRISWRNPEAPAFSYPGTSASLRFTGSSVTMLAKPGSGYFMVELDGREPFKINFADGDSAITIADDLGNGSHQLRVSYAIEGYEKRPEFRGFKLSDDGRMLERPQRSKRSIEFIGNSITCGYGIEADSARMRFAYATENHFYTYAAQTARRLGANYNVVARSGIGMYRNYGGPAEGTPEGCLPALYDRTLFYDAAEKWDFSQFQPDVVCVNLGTNDMSVGKGDSVRYESAARGFVKRLRGYYPKAKIVLLTGSMLTGKNLGIVRRALDRVAADEREVYRFDMSPQDGSLGYGAAYHPSMRQAAKMADELTEFLKSIMNW